MHGGGQAGRFGHARHAAGTNQTTIAIWVGLDDVGDMVADNPLKPPLAGFLFAGRNRNRKGVGDLLRRIKIIERARLFVMDGPLPVDQPALYPLDQRIFQED